MSGIGWAFRNDLATIMETDMGWAMSSTSPSVMGPTSVTADQYTYAGSPTRYSWAMSDTADAIPPLAFQASSGIAVWSIALRNAGSGANQDDIIQWTVQPANTKISFTVLASGSTTIQPVLVVGGSGVGTGAAFDSSVFRYVCLKADASTGTWSAELWLDGVEILSGTSSKAAWTSGEMMIRGAYLGTLANIIGQLEYWPSWSDPAETPKYCTWVPLTEDISEVGTWTPDTGTDDFARVVTPFASASYTENASPSAADRVNMGIGGGGGTDDISDAIGITPGTIHSVTGYVYATGSGGFSAFAVLGDGAAETDGTAGVIGATTSGLVVLRDTKPSGGAWVGSSQPILSFERQ